MMRVGIIGGSGLYGMEGLQILRELNLETPFGSPSDTLSVGELDGAQLVFLPRHGRGHVLAPNEVPYRANVFALKSLGVEWLISVSAVGSLSERLHPGAVVLPDQYIDRTADRPRTFFGQGIVAHVSLADPTCPRLRSALTQATAAAGLTAQNGGTYVCIEGPAFSTRAESNLFRSWGAEVIGMTSMPEARLAREAEMHYATMALVTDYDCWKVDEAAVSVEAVVATLKQNVANVRRILAALVPALDQTCRAGSTCHCSTALAASLITDRSRITPERQEMLAPLLGKYLPAT
jgi:5'-methylthioadenosine phosphorylase